MEAADPRPVVIDLFSGCGGMSWGLEKAGFRAIAAVDNWPIALRTFARNHPGAITVEKDIQGHPPEKVLAALGMEPGDVDVVVGGPPCQGFSKNVPAAYRYLKDPRNQLFRDYLDYIDVIRPKAVVMENVAELFNAYGGRVREELLARLRRFDYAIDARVLVASDYGVPQRRRRFILLASRTGHVPRIPDGRAAPVTAWDAISDLPRVEQGEAFPVGPNPNPTANDFQRWARAWSSDVHNHEAARLSPTQAERYDVLEPGQGIKDLPDRLRPKSGYSGAYGRLDFQGLAPTITRWVFHPGSGRFGHPRERRIITMREAARLQGFTDDFVFLGTKNEIAGQIGNAVPPKLMAELAAEIRACALPGRAVRRAPEARAS